MVIGRGRLEWLSAVFEERLGVPVGLHLDANHIILSTQGEDKALAFVRNKDVKLGQSLRDCCAWWNPRAEGFHPAFGTAIPVPGVGLLHEPMVEFGSQTAIVHFDLPGFMFWVMCRIEELSAVSLDGHQRFPAAQSHAFRHNYLERPAVDEWLWIVVQLLEQVWPNYSAPEYKPSVYLSHDIDSPFLYLYESAIGITRQLLGDLLKRRSICLAIRRYQTWRNVRQGRFSEDPYFKFEWMMDVAEENGIVSEFNFICGCTEPHMDAVYDLNDPQIRELMRRIWERGHRLGLHPSYNTYREPGLILQEADRLRRVCVEEGIGQEEIGGRMHYLRWAHPITMRRLDEAGIGHDSTLGYAEQPGFRCGTCFEYSAYDPLGEESLELRIRPLVAMECSVFSSEYMSMPLSRGADYLRLLKNRCFAVGGEFSLLWHNSELISSKQRDALIRLLGE